MGEEAKPAGASGFSVSIAPPVAFRLAVLAAAGVLLVVGASLFLSLALPGALSPDAAERSADGRLTAQGRLELIWTEGSTPVTHLRLQGAPALDILVQGDLNAQYARNDFVVITGTKTGATLRADFVRHGSDNVLAALPYLGAGAILAGALATEFLASRPAGGARRESAPLRRFPLALPSFRKKDETQAPEAGADNNSGAPAHKG